MDYIKFCIDNPVKVTVGVLLTLLFGLIALFAIPVQLTPNVDKPIISVTTNWTGKSPEEVESQVIEKQEEKVKGVSNLKKMTSTANQGQAQITLEFYLGTEMTRALQEVSDKLREVSSYPDNVDQPVIVAAESAIESPITWMILTSSDPTFDVQKIYDDVDKRVKPYLERVSGVSQINIYGGREREVHIEIDPDLMAQRGITFNTLRRALQQENVNTSAGDLTNGRLDVRIRTIGQYEDLEAVRQTVVTYGPGGPVRVKDLGDVVLTVEKQRSFVHSKGERALAMNAIRETGANVMAVMNQLRGQIKEVNDQVLPAMAREYVAEHHLSPGLTLRIEQVYDETIYIHDSLRLVTDNLWQGGVLAILVLAVFLRKIRPTFIISMAIPLSIIGTFVALAALGRNLNVVSLAGLAFAVGMVMDNAIVVLENTDRHLGMGKRPRQAAYDATSEVWAAILASTLTTLIVFLPVIFMQEEAGQLFRDISLAVCAAVSLSLIVAVSVIPSASARMLKPHQHRKHLWAERSDQLLGLVPLLGRVNAVFANFIYWCLGSWAVRLGVVAIITVASILGAWLLMPPTTYLPAGNRNLVFGIMLVPPAYSMEQNKTLAARMEGNLRPLWEAKSYQDTAKVPVVNAFTGQPVPHVPPIESFFFVGYNGGIFYGAMSGDKDNVQPLTSALPWAAGAIPGVYPLAFQQSLFGRGLGGTNSINVEITGDDMAQIRRAAEVLQGQLRERFGVMAVFPSPQNFNLPGPELQVRTNRVVANDLQINTADLGAGISALVDGLAIGDYRYKGDTIDLLAIRKPGIELYPDQLKNVSLAVSTLDGSVKTVPLSTAAHFVEAEAPQQINRVEQRKAVSLSVTPPANMPLEEATNLIQTMVDKLKAENVIQPGMDARPAGTADDLAEVREALLGKWYGVNLRSFQSLIQSRMFIALLINYLLMCALFESWVYPFVIMFTVPLATVGGFLGLRITHSFVPTQMLDVVTMLGFVILIGTVVNNAILVVAQALNFMRGFGESELDKIERMPPRLAIKESVRTRVRPILMTTLTTLFGLSPLVIKPGAGSEIYRGLGSVVLGGLLLSAMFTLLVVPLLLSLVIDIKAAAYRVLGWQAEELT
ncbi:MAG: efflux RND transporter permease subunit [Phycisphaeraceae bacterium]